MKLFSASIVASANVLPKRRRTRKKTLFDQDKWTLVEAIWRVSARRKSLIHRAHWTLVEAIWRAELWSSRIHPVGLN
jgi:hypothetical protein